MSGDTGITLGALLNGVTGDRLRDALAKAGKGDRERSLITGFACEQAAKAIESEVLNTDAVHLLARAWSSVAELRRYRDQTLNEPDATQRVTFANKTLSAPQKIELTLDFGGQSTLPLVLTVDLKVSFQSVALTVKHGQITEAEFGKAAASAGLKYRDVELIPTRKTDAVSFGKRVFKPGLAIP
jgi:hypothetical protein